MDVMISEARIGNVGKLEFLKKYAKDRVFIESFVGDWAVRVRVTM
jgi:hypothetical protein